jgi:hypothetical protein
MEGVIEADPVASAVCAMMSSWTERAVWTGSATDLLGALGEAVGERVAKSKAWPDSARALSGRLRRAATSLRKIGIEIAFEREGRARTRTINIAFARKWGRRTVRTVRIACARTKSKSCQRLRSSAPADGTQRCGR